MGNVNAIKDKYDEIGKCHRCDVKFTPSNLYL